MNAGLQRLIKRIEVQDAERQQQYSKSLLHVCDALIRRAAERIVDHDVFGAGGRELDPDHTGRIVSLLEAKRALTTWRAPARTFAERSSDDRLPAPCSGRSRVKRRMPPGTEDAWYLLNCCIF